MSKMGQTLMRTASPDSLTSGSKCVFRYLRSRSSDVRKPGRLAEGKRSRKSRTQSLRKWASVSCDRLSVASLARSKRILNQARILGLRFQFVKDTA